MLAEALVQLGVLRPESLDSARQRQQLTGEDLDEVVLAMQLVSEREMLRATARQLGAQYLTTERVAELKVPDEVMDRVPVRVAEALNVLPFRANPDGTLWCLVPAPLSDDQAEKLKKVADARSVSQILARRRAINAAVRRHYYRDPFAFQSLEEAELLARLAPPVPDTVPDPEPDARKEKTTSTSGPEVLVEISSGGIVSSTSGAQPGSAAGSSAGAPHQDPEATPARGIDIAALVMRAGNELDTTPRALHVLPEDVARLQRENERLRVAQSLSAGLASVHHLDVLASELLAAMLDLFSAEGAGFALTGENGAPLLLESRRRTGAADQGGLSISSSIVRNVVNSERALLVLDAQADDRFAREESIITRAVKSVICAPIRTRTKVFGALYIEATAASAFDANDLETLQLIAQVAGGTVENALARQHLEDEVVTRHTLRRFLPSDVVDACIRGDGPSLLPLRATGTLLVARIPDFAALAGAGGEDDPDEVMRRIDGLLDALTLPVFEHGGTLQGEQRGGVTAVFGPPRHDDDHEDRAVAAAIEIARRAATGDATFGQLIQIGIACGPMILGAMGPLSRLQFLAVGETAELAYRLCARAKPGEILSTGAAREKSSRFLTWEEQAEPLAANGEPRPVFSLRWR